MYCNIDRVYHYNRYLTFWTCLNTRWRSQATAKPECLHLFQWCLVNLWCLGHRDQQQWLVNAQHVRIRSAASAALPDITRKATFRWSVRHKIIVHIHIFIDLLKLNVNTRLRLFCRLVFDIPISFGVNTKNAVR